MADPQVNIRIKTAADTAGVQAAKKAVKETADAAKRAARESAAEAKKAAAEAVAAAKAQAAAEKQAAKEASDAAKRAAKEAADAAKRAARESAAEAKKAAAEAIAAAKAQAAAKKQAAREESAAAKAAANIAAAAARQEAAAKEQALKKTRQLRGGVQQLGYQIGDFAVQVGGGTSALVAFSQQGSQILQLLGPWGAVAGAALAIGAAVVKATGEMDNAGDEAESMADRIAKSAEQAGEAISEKFAKEAKIVAQSFKDSKADVDAYNSSLTRTIELEKLRFDEQIKQQDAQAALRIKEIESSSLNEEQKLVEIAKIRDGIAERQRQKNLNDIKVEEDMARAQVEVAARLAQQKQDAIKSAEQRAFDARVELGRKEREKANAEARLAAQKEVEAAQRRFDMLSLAAKTSAATPGLMPGAGLAASKAAQAKTRLEEAQARLAGLPSISAATTKEAAPAYIKTLEKEIQAISSEAETLEKTFKDNGELQVELKDAIRELKEAIEKQAFAAQAGEIRRQGIAVEASTQAGISMIDLQAGQRALQKQQDKEFAARQIKELEARKAQEGRVLSGMESSFTEASARGAEAPGAARTGTVDVFREAEKAGAGGYSEREMMQLANTFKQRLEGMSNSNVKAFLQMFAAMQEQKAKMEQLEGQIKELRTNG